MFIVSTHNINQIKNTISSLSSLSKTPVSQKGPIENNFILLKINFVFNFLILKQ